MARRLGIVEPSPQGVGKESSMRIWVAFGFLIGLLALFPLAGSASACATASLRLDPSAGPGDTVSFSISGIEPGATYTLNLAGHQVASGTNNAPYNGVSGTFTMPNLGTQPVTVTGFGHTFHAADSDAQDPVSSMAYEPPAPSSTSSPAASAPSKPEPEPEPEPKAVHPAPGVKVQPPVAVAQHTAKKQKQESPTTGSGARPAPADAVRSAPGPGDPNSGGSGEAKGSAEESSGVPHEVLDGIGSTTRVGPADVPTVGLLALGLIFIAGTAVAAFVIYLMRRGPDPKAAIKAPAPLGHDPVEVELQEMIAEEMARRLLSDLDLGEPSVSSR
jgi:hypothetical protein